MSHAAYPCRLAGPQPPLALPVDFHTIRSRIGLDPDEQARPYARFFTPEVAPSQVQALEALAQGIVPHQDFTAFENYADEIQRPGYLPIETGWTLFPDGVMGVAVLTHMPGVRAEMWDWWFAWHSVESARYRLWHPQSHQAAMWAQPLTDAATMSPRQRYIGRTSLVHELIGGMALRLAIRFIDPAEVGVPAGSFDGTLIYGRGSLLGSGMEEGCLLHYVRNVPGGCEVRSRFYFNLRPECVGAPAGTPPPEIAVTFRGPGMVAHSAAEMNHLAQFLPALHAEFGQQ